MDRRIKDPLAQNINLMTKLGYVVRMVVVSVLPHAEVAQNDHRKDATQFSIIAAEFVCRSYSTGILNFRKLEEFFDQYFLTVHSSH